MSRQIIEARTIFSIRPTEAPLSPPLSPPPTSPLPQLPSSPPLAIFKASPPSGSAPRPIRPPRPQTSLPDLNPRTTTSPKITTRQRASKIAAQTKAPPIKPHGPPSRSARKSGPKTLSRLPAALQLLTPPLRSGPKVTEEVISALPLRFQQTPTHCGFESRMLRESHNNVNHLSSWSFPQTLPTRSPKSKRSRKEIKKPLARSALFIPNATAEQSLRTQEPSFETSSLPQLTQTSCHFNNLQQSLTWSQPQFPTSVLKSPTGKTHSSTKLASSISDRRYGAVTAFTFDLNQSQDPQILIHGALQEDDNITSLPALPPAAPHVKAAETPLKAEQCCFLLHTLRSPEKDAQIKVHPFLSLPYSQTSNLAGPAPKTELDFQRRQTRNGSPTSPAKLEGTVAQRIMVTSPAANVGAMVDSGETAAEVDVEWAGPAEREIRWAKLKGVPWIVVTISLVMLATGGILVGILWKLNSLAEGG